MKIVVCGNSISFGLELNAPAADRDALRFMIRQALEPNKNSWPGQLQEKLNVEVINYSQPASGFYNNVARCLDFAKALSKYEIENHLFLIDGTMFYQLSLVANGDPRAPVFFPMHTIQNTYVRNLSEEFINCSYWSTIILLQQLKIRFRFFCAMYPYVTYENLKGYLNRPDLREEYARYMLESQWIKTSFKPPEEVAPHFLTTKTLIGTLDRNEVTPYIHPVSTQAHSKILNELIFPEIMNIV